MMAIGDAVLVLHKHLAARAAERAAVVACMCHDSYLGLVGDVTRSVLEYLPDLRVDGAAMIVEQSRTSRLLEEFVTRFSVEPYTRIISCGRLLAAYPEIYSGVESSFDVAVKFHAYGVTIATLSDFVMDRQSIWTLVSYDLGGVYVSTYRARDFWYAGCGRFICEDCIVNVYTGHVVELQVGANAAILPCGLHVTGDAIVDIETGESISVDADIKFVDDYGTPVDHWGPLGEYCSNIIFPTVGL